MHRRPAPSCRPRPMQGIFLRLARKDDLPRLAEFCQEHHRPDRVPGRSLAEVNALLNGHVDTMIVAIQHDTVAGVALCGVSKGRMRLLELIVRPGAACARIERRLLRRTLRNLRVLGLGTLHFGCGEPAVAKEPLPPCPDPPVNGLQSAHETN